jgi:hypothetical protein
MALCVCSLSTIKQGLSLVKQGKSPGLQKQQSLLNKIKKENVHAMDGLMA